MEAVISKCANDVLVQKLSELDRNCAIDSSIECPYTAETGVNIFFYSKSYILINLTNELSLIDTLLYRLLRSRGRRKSKVRPCRPDDYVYWKAE